MKKLNLQEIQAVSGAGFFSFWSVFCPPSHFPAVSTKAWGEEDGGISIKPPVSTVATLAIGIGEEGDNTPVYRGTNSTPFGEF